MLPFSENNPNKKMFGVPPNTFAIGYVHNDNLPLGNIAITICHSKQLQEDLMVFSNDSLHFLKINIKFVEFTPNYLVALIQPIPISDKEVSNTAF